MMADSPLPVERTTGLVAKSAGRHRWTFYQDGRYRGSLRWSKGSGKAVWTDPAGVQAEFFRNRAKTALARGFEFAEGVLTIRAGAKR